MSAADITAEVARLVRLTVTHDPAAGDTNGEVLCDADLAILAAAPEEYAAYAAAVREEYGFVPDDAFRDGRAAVLRQLLGLPRLFRTPHGIAGVGAARPAEPADGAASCSPAETRGTESAHTGM